MLIASLGMLEATVLLFIFAVLALLTETERFGWATLAVVGSVVIAQWMQWADLWGAVRANAMVSAVYVGGYVVTGVAWSFVKWFSFLMRFRDVLKDVKDQRSEHYRAVTYRGFSLTRRPQAAEAKGKITAWMVFWPFSLIGTVLNDPIRRLFAFLFGRFKHLYQRMSDAVFKDVEFEDKGRVKASEGADNALSKAVRD
jgi:hypothetical protein